jgi:hypothetical protein
MTARLLHVLHGSAVTCGVTSARSLRTLAVSQITKNPALWCGRACRPIGKLVPVTTQICEASPFHWRQQIQLGNGQAVKQSGDSRCNGYGHVRLPRQMRAI